MSNRRVLTLVRHNKQHFYETESFVQLGRVLGSPAVLQDMAHSLGMTLGNEAMLREFP